MRNTWQQKRRGPCPPDPVSQITTFNLLTGFLGSGKTTLLSNLLYELSGRHRIAVIQNEFAPTGVDGKILNQSNTDFHLVELNNGSVFCVCQLGRFEKQLQKLLAEVKPEIIFLEASGLADPISIIDLLTASELQGRVILDQVISLVDAPNFFRGLSMLQRFRHQLMVADTVLINKLDRFEGCLADIESEIRILNPYARILATTQARITWPELTGTGTDRNKAARQHGGSVSMGRPDMAACVLRTHDELDRPELQSFLDRLEPGCPRIKGYLNLRDGKTVSIHSVFSTREIKEIEGYSGPSELIAFGDGLTGSELRKAFRESRQST